VNGNGDLGDDCDDNGDDNRDDNGNVNAKPVTTLRPTPPPAAIDVDVGVGVGVAATIVGEVPKSLRLLLLRLTFNGGTTEASICLKGSRAQYTGDFSLISESLHSTT
jgi:hypothetical protein